MGRIGRLEQIVHGMSAIMDIPLTVKMRTGLQEDKHTAHTLLPKLRDWGVSMVTVGLRVLCLLIVCFSLVAK